MSECHWPSVVAVQGYNKGPCSGVYLGNRIVATAGHCIYGANSHSGSSQPGAFIRFGEDTNAPHQVVSVKADCTVRGDLEQYTCPGLAGGDCYRGADVAYCVLEDEPWDLIFGLGGAGSHSWNAGAVVMPMAPTGCERDWLYNRLYIPPFNVDQLWLV